MRLNFILIVTVLLLGACQPEQEELLVNSPDGTIKLVLDLADGFPHYSIFVDEQVLMRASGLGFNFR